MNEVTDTNSSDLIRDLIEKGQNIAIVPSKVVGANSFCAAAGLFHMLAAQEKNVSLIYPGKVPEICENLINRDQITSEVGNRELLVSIDYSNTVASKVHYATVDDVLTLRLSPVDRNFDLSRVHARLSGAQYDVVFTIGVNEYHDLGNIQAGLAESLQNAKIINIDNTSRNVKFGTVSVIDTTADTLSMVIFKNAPSWGLVPDTKAAKALLTGVTYRNSGIDK